MAWMTWVGLGVPSWAQDAKLAYQGRLTEGGSPATGGYQMRFKLFDTPEVGTGTQQGGVVEIAEVGVKDGVFSVTLDFGIAVFDGSARFLEIAVRPVDGLKPLSTLSPRQAITPVPYAIRTLSAAPAVGGLKSDAGGNVAIGTNGFPAGVRLNVDGVTRLSPGGSGGFVQVGTPNGETGISVTGSNRFDLRFSRDTLTLAAGGNSGPPPPWNGVIMNTNGNVGVGMASLASNSLWKLEVNGLSRFTPVGAAGGAIQLSTPDAETGMSILGRNRVDFRFDDTTAKIVTVPGNGPPLDNNGLAIDLEGRVGVGTTAPKVALEVASGSLAVTGYTPRNPQLGKGLFFDSFETSGAQIQAYDYSRNASTPLYLNTPEGDVQIGPGTPKAKLHVLSREANRATVIAESVGAGGVGLYAMAPGDGLALHAEGHVRQAPDKGGFVKAMAYIATDGSVIRSFTPNGKLTVTREATGNYILDFGFPVKDRFFSVSTKTRSDGGDNAHVGASFDIGNNSSPNHLRVSVYELDDLDSIDWVFMVLVF